jgi:hypothetical protein
MQLNLAMRLLRQVKIISWNVNLCPLKCIADDPNDEDELVRDEVEERPRMMSTVSSRAVTCSCHGGTVLGAGQQQPPVSNHQGLPRDLVTLPHSPRSITFLFCSVESDIVSVGLC